MRREWREKPSVAAAPQPKWLRFTVAGIVAAMVLVAFSQFLLLPWFMRSGLSANPGNFISLQPINYPVCAPWKDREADFARADLQVTDAVSQKALAAGDRPTIGVLLPRRAKILKIYCATGTKECSWLSCSPPLSFLATDSVYSRGRVINIVPCAAGPDCAPPKTFIATDNVNSAQTGKTSLALNVRIWVVWR